MKRKSGSLLKKIVFVLALLVFGSVFLFSGYQVLEYVYEESVQKSVKSDLIKKGVTSASSSPEEIRVPIKADDEGKTVEKNILLTPDITVDFDLLKKQYGKMIGWLYMQDSIIHEPVMQAEDNAYFVHRLPDGKENRAGSLFMDYRDPADLSQWGHILYGHNMKNGTMFGPLMNYRYEEYFKENPYMFYFTPEKTYRGEVFAAIHTTTDTLVFSMPDSDEEIEEYLRYVYARSVFSSGISVTKDDTVLVLTTCSTGNTSPKRFVVFLKLVEI